MSTPTSACPSKLQLERILHGELVPDEDAALHQHLEGCQRCGAWLARARDETAALRAEVDSTAFAERLASRLRERDRLHDPGRRPEANQPYGGLVARWLLDHRTAWVALAAAAAVLLLTVTQTFRPREQTVVDTTRVKGSTFVRLHLKRAGQVRPLDADDTTQAGDAIRFEVFPGPHRFVLVLSLHENGETSVYAPFDGAESLAVTPDHSLLLDGSVVLDTDDDELLLVLLSDEPIAAARAETAVRAAYRRARGQLHRIHGLDLDAATHLRLLRRAESPP